MNKKTRLALIIGIPAILIVAVVVLLFVWVNYFIPGLIASQVNEYLPDNTSVGRITAAFPAGITLHDVEVEQPDEFGVYGRADKAVLKLSLWKFILGQFDETAIREIKLDEFDIIIKAKPKAVPDEALPAAPIPVEEKEESVLDKLFGLTGNQVKDIPGGFPPLAGDDEPDTMPVTTPDLNADVDRASKYQPVPGGNDELNCKLIAGDGTIQLQRGQEFQELARDIELDGNIKDGLLEVESGAAPIGGGSLKAQCLVALDMSNGAITYNAEALTVEGYLEKFGRPDWIKKARGEMNLNGTFAWRIDGPPLHEAEMSISDGAVRFSAAKIKVDFTDVNGRFLINNDRFEADEAGFVFADARWSIDGKVSTKYIDFTFAVKDFGLQNLVEMVVGDFPLILIGRGDVTIRLVGPTYFPEVKVNIKKVRL
jgi:hypothetical protein